MKLFGRIWNLKSLFSRKLEDDASKKERFMSGIIRTAAFSGQSLQEKILSLGKLINIFRMDHGFTPRALERTLETLSAELTRQNHKTWHASYSEIKVPVKRK